MLIDDFGRSGIIVILIMLAVIIAMKYSDIKRQSLVNAKTRFLSNISHEIRMPLNTLIGLNRLMEHHLDDKERMQDYLKKNAATSEYLLTLLNDILDMSKIQDGNIHLRHEPMLLDSVISDVLAMQQENMNEKSQVFQQDIDIPHSCVYGDELRIKQILMNIMSNAVKFTPEHGQITMKASQSSPDKNTVVTTFAVTDTGCGMSREFQKKIFESFTQENNQHTQGNTGTGLGMSISYKLVKKMGGTLEVDSELGRGSCFTLAIPLQISSDRPAGIEAETDADSPFNISVTPEAAETEKQAGKTGPESRSRKILLAEDNALNAGVVQEILALEGYDVTVAFDGKQAVEIFADSPIYEYDVILMDVKMPVMNGYDAAMKIRSLDRADASSVIIFACTANTSREDKKRAEQANMNGFLSKPINIDMFLQKLDEILHKPDAE